MITAQKILEAFEEKTHTPKKDTQTTQTIFHMFEEETSSVSDSVLMKDVHTALQHLIDGTMTEDEVAETIGAILHHHNATVEDTHDVIKSISPETTPQETVKEAFGDPFGYDSHTKRVGKALAKYGAPFTIGTLWGRHIVKHALSGAGWALKKAGEGAEYAGRSLWEPAKDVGKTVIKGTVVDIQ